MKFVKPKRTEKSIVAATAGEVRRTAIQINEAWLTGTRFVTPGQSLPLVIYPAIGSVRLVDWAGHNKDRIKAYLQEFGAVIFRDFGAVADSDFEQLVRSVGGEPLAYTYGSTPRTAIRGRIYSSSEYPAEREIPLHNEMAYALQWPMHLWFFCECPAVTGGETPLANCRNVTKRIPEGIRQKFSDKGVMYVRNYDHSIDLPWESVFETTDRRDVERYCSQAGIEFSWKPGNRLRTSQVCQATANHPVGGEPIWFNQAHLFHISSLDHEAQKLLMSEFRREDLPRHCYYGDGSEIEDHAIARISEAYEQEKVIFQWHEGDILLLDNMLVAHGRMPYVAPRMVLVAMTDPFTAR